MLSAATRHESVRAAAAAGTQLFIHGGRNNFVLEDLFVLDLARKEWTDVVPGEHTPPPRHSHLITLHADKLYMYGGYDQLGAWSDAMFCLPIPYGQPFTAARYLTYHTQPRPSTAECHQTQSWDSCQAPLCYGQPHSPTRLWQELTASCFTLKACEYIINLKIFLSIHHP